MYLDIEYAQEEVCHSKSGHWNVKTWHTHTQGQRLCYIVLVRKSSGACWKRQVEHYWLFFFFASWWIKSILEMCHPSSVIFCLDLIAQSSSAMSLSKPHRQKSMPDKWSSCSESYYTVQSACLFYWLSAFLQAALFVLAFFFTSLYTPVAFHNGKLKPCPCIFYRMHVQSGFFPPPWNMPVSELTVFRVCPCLAPSVKAPDPPPPWPQ